MAAPANFLTHDLRGEFIRGWDAGRGIDAGRVFGTAQGDAFKTHEHYAHLIPINAGGVTDGFMVNRGKYGNNVGSVKKDAATFEPTSGAAAETRPRNVALLPCIKY
jgi:phage-related tail fiber protein